ncbi:hypothetical protein PHJA_000643100, partial [Phtheirospermum japonicum]
RDDLEAWDLQDPLSPSGTRIAWRAKKASRSQLELELKHFFARDYQFLVVAEQSDQLYHVRQYVLPRMGPDGSFVDDVSYGPQIDDESVSYKTVGFDVHSDQETGSLLHYMDRSLGGLALFVGPNDGGFALSPAEFPGLKPNSIYYTDSEAMPEWCDQAYRGHDVGIFDYENETFSSCYYPCNLKSILTNIVPTTTRKTGN